MESEKLVKKAHKLTSNNRTLIESSKSCGCCYCCAIFEPSKITTWIGHCRNSMLKTTAVCPQCGIDAIIPDASGIEINHKFLKDMFNRWFGI